MSATAPPQRQTLSAAEMLQGKGTLPKQNPLATTAQSPNKHGWLKAGTWATLQALTVKREQLTENKGLWLLSQLWARSSLACN